MDLQEIDRETLYAEVWKEPMTKVAERYGVSSSSVSYTHLTLPTKRIV